MSDIEHRVEVSEPGYEDFEAALPWVAEPPPPPPVAGTVAPDRKPAGGEPSGHGRSRHGAGVFKGPLADGSAIVKAGLRDLKGRSPWILGSGAILVAFAFSWFASFLSAFRHQRGLTGQARVMQMFGIGTITWAVAILLAVALVATGRKFDLCAASSRLLNDLMPLALVVAAFAVAASAAIGMLIELSNFGNGVETALSGLVGYIGVVPVAAATAWWAHQLHQRVT